MEERLPRKLVAILYADVVGYSRLTGEDEDATHKTLTERLDLIAETIDRHRGQVMHYAGDAVLAKFDAAVDAMSAAVAIQSEHDTCDTQLAPDRQVQFRIGINLGDVIEDRGDIYGDGVNIAARLESLAEPGGICISDAVRSAMGRKLNLYYEDMGEQTVKNIVEPVRAYNVMWPERDRLAATLSQARKPRRSEHGRNTISIAVMPLSTIGTEESTRRLADGLTAGLKLKNNSPRAPLVVRPRNV